MRCWAVAVAALLASVSSPAAAAPASLQGLWEGSLGGLPVRACFTIREWGTFGAYYYRSKLKLIGLDADQGDSAAFLEGGGSDPKRPRWQVERVTATELGGHWTGGGRTLAIQLSRLPGRRGDESPCASAAFHAPRLEGVGIVERRAAKDGVGYTRLILSHHDRFDSQFETFALDGRGAAVARINAALRKPLASDPPEWLECVLGALEQGPFEGGSYDKDEPSLISARWLGVVHHYDGFCGGAHPNAGYSYRLFDLSTGAEIDLHDWLTAKAAKHEGSGSERIATLRPALRNLVTAGWKAQSAECGEAVRDQEFWNIGLERTGFVLTPDLPHVILACGDDFHVSFARLRPFLTPQAAAYAGALSRERR